MHFYPRSPCGERLVAIHYTDGALNFYPRSPCGERQLLYIISTPKSNFYPRSPCGERRKCAVSSALSNDFYPRSPCGERHLDWIIDTLHDIISIHALLAESDQTARQQAITAEQFLSTLSLRRATGGPGGQNAVILHFYPRSPCGERHWPRVIVSPTLYFYPRSPCGERPSSGSWSALPGWYFYPRSPCGERHSPDGVGGFSDISIHALLAESDDHCHRLQKQVFAFLSTLSLRRATVLDALSSDASTFLSTLSLRRATCWVR